jgi:hypothetical protein
MKHIILKSLACSGLLMFGMTAWSQDRDRDRDRDDRYRDEEQYHRRDRDEGWWRGHLFQRVREDLNHVQAVTSPFSSDEYRLSRTKEELSELQNKMEAGRYDQPELDDVIAALQRVVADNRLSSRDRDMLSDDLNRLREYRERHERY